MDSGYTKSDLLSEVNTRFPVRNSREQKAAFRAYALSEAKAYGIGYAAEEDCGGHTNLIFGDPGKARIIFTAHYDTPRRMLLPNFMLVTNGFLYWAYNIGLALIMALIGLAAAFEVKELFGEDLDKWQIRALMLLVFYAVYFILLRIMIKGPVNRHNLNDNTSGVAAVMTMMRESGDNNKVAYILFDDEEKGKKGSKAYAKDHPGTAHDALILNMDCVGNGDAFLFCPSDEAVKDPLYLALRDELTRDKGLNARFYAPHKAQTNSDHKSFVKGVGICACFYKRFIGYYVGRIHTERDTQADPRRIAALAGALSRFCVKATGAER